MHDTTRTLRKVARSWMTIIGSFLTACCIWVVKLQQSKWQKCT